MTATEILLGVHSILLTLLGILLSFVGFFLRDFHAQFKELTVTVTTLCLEADSYRLTQALRPRKAGRADQDNTRRELDDLHGKTRNQ